MDKIVLESEKVSFGLAKQLKELGIDIVDVDLNGISIYTEEGKLVKFTSMTEFEMIYAPSLSGVVDYVRDNYKINVTSMTDQSGKWGTLIRNFGGKITFNTREMYPRYRSHYEAIDEALTDFFSLFPEILK